MNIEEFNEYSKENQLPIPKKMNVLISRSGSIRLSYSKRDVNGRKFGLKLKININFPRSPIKKNAFIFTQKISSTKIKFPSKTLSYF